MDFIEFKNNVVTFTGKATLMIGASAVIGATVGASCMLGSYYAAKAVKEQQQREKTERIEDSQPSKTLSETQEKTRVAITSREGKSSALSTLERELKEKPTVHKTSTFKNLEGVNVIDGNESLRRLNSDQRKQLEQYVEEYEETLEEAGKSSKKTTFTEA